MFKSVLRSLMFSLSALMMFIIFTGVGSVDAQNSAWTVWLYSAATGDILLVNQTGTVTGEFTLPLAQGFNGYGRWAVVSPGGRYIAYTAFDSTQQSPGEQLFVYDQVIGAIRFTDDMTGTLASGFEFSTAAMAFDEGAGRFAFGYLAETDGWQVVVGDFATSSVLAVLNPGNAPSLQLPGNIVPVVQRLDGQSVTFTAVAYGTNFLPTYPAFRWDFTSGDITPDDRYTTIVIDSDQATGQVAAAGFDANQPHPDANGPSLILNVLDVITAGGERARLYTEADGSINQVRFIENGARILTEVQASDNQTHLKVLNRDGSVAGEIVGSLRDLTGTPDGFVGMFDNGGAPAIAYINTTASTLTPTTLWSGTPNTTYTLVRVTPG